VTIMTISLLSEDFANACVNELKQADDSFLHFCQI
jgi:hypothetical protein